MPIAPDLAGSALEGRYELHVVIGEGTFGRVYRGRDRRLQRPVAIKVIKPWWGEDPDWAERFEREAQLLARVSHPGVVQIYDVGQSEEGLYYVAELVEGESLAGRLRGGRLATTETVRIAGELCRALAHMHGCGVIHRDIKPANVLLGPGGQVKVGDFSIARLAEGSTDGPATVAGTPRYMAPEQARGAPGTAQTDIYSAGVVLYEMLVGRPPFAAGTPVELALRHLGDAPPPLPDDVPPALGAVALRALAKAPRERFPSAIAMAQAIERAAAAPPRRPTVTAAQTPSAVTAASPPPGEPTRVAPRYGQRRTANPSARRRAGALVLAVTALVAGMLGLASLASLAAGGASQPRRHAAARPAAPVLLRVPDLTGESSRAAAAVLTNLALTPTTVAVPAPGAVPGTVMGQLPAPGGRVTAHAQVQLRVAEVPRWRTVAVLAGTGTDHSPIVRIRGTGWRLVYAMHYVGTCTFILFCNGPTARVIAFPAGDTTAFDLSPGDANVRQMGAGSGQFEVAVTPGSDAAAWRIELQDRF